MRVGGGVVVGVTHVDGGAGGERDGLGVAVDGLAVDVPVVNEDEGAALAGGKDGPALHAPGEIVGVGVDGEEVYVGGEFEGVLYGEAGGAGWDVECGVIFKLEEDGELGGGGWGEVEADAGANGLGLAGGLEVHIQDEVVAGVETPGLGGGLDEGGGVGLPVEEVTVGVEGVAGVDEDVHAGDAELPVGGVGVAEGGGAVDGEVSVVNDGEGGGGFAAGLDLHGTDPAGLGEGRGKMKLRKRSVPEAGTDVAVSISTMRSGGPSCQSLV